MYRTIEGDIKNGRFTSPDEKNLPAEAHVLVTVLTEKTGTEILRKPTASMRGVLKRYMDPSRMVREKTAWV